MLKARSEVRRQLAELEREHHRQLREEKVNHETAMATLRNMHAERLEKIEQEVREQKCRLRDKMDEMSHQEAVDDAQETNADRIARQMGFMG